MARHHTMCCLCACVDSRPTLTKRVCARAKRSKDEQTLLPVRLTPVYVSLALALTILIYWQVSCMIMFLMINKVSLIVAGVILISGELD